MAQEDFQKLLSVNTAHCAVQMQRRSLLSKVLVELAAAAQVLNTEDDTEPHPASIPTACPPWSSAFHQLKTFGCEHETRNGTK